MNPRQITVRATKYDGSDHWVHPAQLLQANPDGFVQTATAYGTIVQRAAGTFTSNYNTRGHYWPDRYFNVIRLEVPDAATGLWKLDGFYCNIATPVRFDGRTLGYTDLQLDVRVFAGPDGSLTHRILDEDEFDAARNLFAYPAELIDNCWAAVEQVIALVTARRFPFD
jgi:protein associated with RNAse G/E